MHRAIKTKWKNGRKGTDCKVKERILKELERKGNVKKEDEIKKVVMKRNREDPERKGNETKGSKRKDWKINEWKGKDWKGKERNERNERE